MTNTGFITKYLGTAMATALVGSALMGCTSAPAEESAAPAVATLAGGATVGTRDAVVFEDETIPRDTTKGDIMNDGSRAVCTAEDEVAALWDCRARHPGLECLIFDCYAIFGFITYHAKVVPPDDANHSVPEVPTTGTGGGNGGTPHQDGYPQPELPSLPGGGYIPPSGYPSGGGGNDFCTWIFYCNQPSWGMGTWGPPQSGYVSGTSADCEAQIGVSCGGYGGSCTSL